MTLHQYRQLNEDEQFDALEHRAVQIGEREDGFCTVKLYQLDAFYVELHHHAHFNVIVRLHSFAGTDRLTPYLDEIDLEGLFPA